MAGCIQFVSSPGILLAARTDAWERLAIYGVLLLAVLATIAAVAVFVKRTFLGPTDEQGPTTSNMLSNFREMYAQGELSDEEYRTIKTKLNARFRSELKDHADEASAAEENTQTEPPDGSPRT